MSDFLHTDLNRRQFFKLGVYAGLGTLACGGLSACAAESGPGTTEYVRLQVFAANSLLKAMTEATAAYSEKYSNISFFDTQFLSSGQLNTQLQAGAYADILFSASTDKMDIAENQGSILSDTRVNMFANDLVVVRKIGSDISIDSLEDLLNSSYKVAIGDESVPAGNYARKAFAALGAYTNTLGYGGFFKGISPMLDGNVGNVCQHVQNGEVDFGLVYSSDVYRYTGVEIVYSIPKELTGDVIYPAAVCAQSTQVSASQAFLNWCANDPDALKIWQRWGFEMY